MRATLWTTSVVMALAALIGMGRLWAEGRDRKPAKPAPLRTRIALVNLTYVIKNYQKYAEKRMILGKKTDEAMKTFYLDVQEAAKRYATAHDLDIVLSYNDPPITREGSPPVPPPPPNAGVAPVNVPPPPPVNVPPPPPTTPPQRRIPSARQTSPENCKPVP